MIPLSITTLGRAFAIMACIAVAACSAGAASTQPPVTPGRAEVPSTGPGTPVDTAAPLTTATPMLPAGSSTAPASTATTPPAPPFPSPRPTSIKPGEVVETLVGDVRVRSKPRITDSFMYEPLLPSGTKLYVLDGPVAGSGYQWFWVAQLSSIELPSGWVAAAGRDGETWLGPGAYDCPAVPDDVHSLADLPRGVGLACFSRHPITFRARLFEPNGDVTPGDDWIDPGWLFSSPVLSTVFEPSAVRPEGPSLRLLLDPEGHYPGYLDWPHLPAEVPVGRYVDGDRWTVPHVVQITGMFDHPAAASCEWVSFGEPTAAELPFDPAVARCRLEFAVTRIVVP